jgi:hypothetical protein
MRHFTTPWGELVDDANQRVLTRSKWEDSMPAIVP